MSTWTHPAALARELLPSHDTDFILSRFTLLRSPSFNILSCAVSQYQYSADTLFQYHVMAPTALSPQPVLAQLSSPSVKPILKRKRSPDTLSGSQLKRPKVDFKYEVDIQLAENAGEKPAALIREEVKSAIAHLHGSGNEDYDQIKNRFALQPGVKDAATNTLLTKYLESIIPYAALLTKSHTDLVQAVLKHHWLARDEAFANYYTRFLNHLVTSRGLYLHQILGMLVENFAHLSTSAGPAPPDPTTRSLLRDRVHKTLKSILRVVPSASGTLITIVRSTFPYADESRRVHVQYVRNILRLIEYCPELKTDVFDLITDRLIKLDVEVQIDVEDLDEDVGDILAAQSRSITDTQDSQPYDEDEDIPSDEDQDDDDEDLTQDERRFKTLTSAVAKMDALLDILFAEHASNTSKPDKLASESTFELLLSQFRKTILKTYRSRHTQFLLFHFAQTSSDRADRFIDTCLQTLQSRSDNVVRISAAAYLASFVARGARLSKEAVNTAFASLSTYAETLRRQHEPICRGPDRRKYDVYYSTIQAMIYIFCFRWRDLLVRTRRRSSAALRPSFDLDDDSDVESDDEDLDEDEALLTASVIWPAHVKDSFNLHVHSRLNPLKVCAPEIVDEFARIAHHLSFMYVHSILSANRRIRLSGTVSSSSLPSRETSLDSLRGDRHLQLDAYFPFDPYNLPISKRWLEGDYNYWREPPGMAVEPQTSVGQAEHKTPFEADSSSDGDSSEEDGDDDDVDDLEVRTATPGSDDH